MAKSKPKILIVEDDVLISMLLQEFAEDCGCAVIGPVGSLEKGLAAAEAGGFDGAILDINLGREWVWPLAERLEAMSVPFLISTGYGHDDVPERFRYCPLVTKPMTLESVSTALREIGMPCAEAS